MPEGLGRDHVRAFSRTRRLASAFGHLGSSFTAIAVATGVALPTAALAQAGTSTLRGHAAPGVPVVATEVATGAVRRSTAGPDGTYVIAGLPAGNYHVTAGAKAADVVVPVASVQVQNFDTTVATAGAIVVTGTRPTAEVHTSQVNQFVTLHDIAALPQTTRNFLEFADTVPGVQFQVDKSGRTSLRGGAQLASNVNVYIDGVSQKDLVGSGGGSNGSGSGIAGSGGNGGAGDPGNPFPQLAIAEYKVVTSNYSAEYGDASSAVIIAQTKSGTNRFQAEAFGTFTNQDLRAKTPIEVATHAAKAKIPDWQYGASVSGPIVPDVAHFFFTWEHKSLSDQTTVIPNGPITLAQAQALLPADLASQYGAVTNPFTENLYFGKIDLEPSTNDRIEATGKLRLEHSFTGGSGTLAASTRAPYRNNDKRADIRWQHSGNDWTNQVLLAYQNTNSSTDTTSASPQNHYVYYPDPATNLNADELLVTGGPGQGVGVISQQRGYTLQDDFTYSGLHLAGDHTLRAGFSYGGIKLRTANASSDLANATYFYAVTSAGVSPTPTEVQFPNLSAGFTNASVTTTDKQYSAYVQDDWNVNRHLTLNLGVRWDHEVVPAFLNYITPAGIVAAINGPYPGGTMTVAQTLAQGATGYNIFDYVSTGHNRKAPNNFSPRLGFSYDINGDNRHVIFGGYARAYTRNLFSTLALEVTKEALNGNPEVYFPSPNTQDSFASSAPGGGCFTAADLGSQYHCYAWLPAYLTAAGLAGFQAGGSSNEADLINNNLKTPYADQFSLGIRNKIGDWNTQATVSYIASYDAIVGHLGNRYSNGAFYQNGCQWCGSSGVPGYGNTVLWDNAGKDRLFQIGLGAQRPYTRQSGWSATISYTFSAGAQNNLAGGTNPYQLANNEYMFDIPFPWQAPMLRATAVPRHRVVATYTRDLWWGISTAAKLELATPTSAAGVFPCPNFPCGSYQGNVVYVSRPPNDFLGYKDLDLQFTKDFSFFHLLDAYARVDILNVFNWANYDPSSYQFPNAAATPYYLKGGAIIGVPRTIKFTAGVRFGDVAPRPPAVVEAPPPPPPPPPPAQTCADGSVVAVGATCPVAPPPPSAPPPPAAAPERG